MCMLVCAHESLMIDCNEFDYKLQCQGLSVCAFVCVCIRVPYACNLPLTHSHTRSPTLSPTHPSHARPPHASTLQACAAYSNESQHNITSSYSSATAVATPVPRPNASSPCPTKATVITLCARCLPGSSKAVFQLPAQLGPSSAGANADQDLNASALSFSRSLALASGLQVSFAFAAAATTAAAAAAAAAAAVDNV